ncbi:MAG: LysE family translocator [Desulfuromonadales bacterium]|nr:LysE family translocator [Desulfuromonadales bacterium]MBN2791326.1 LysE family translocator [Desulfuromonadales bacterium]
MDFPAEFLTVALVHLLAVASPGPDFAMVLRQSRVAGRKTAIWTSVGIGLGILVHVAYTLLGLGLVISQSVQVFNLIKLGGAGYLLYIGWKSLRAGPGGELANANENQGPGPGVSQALRSGFLTNALNPKATLFFLSLFSVIIKPDTPQIVQVLYGLYMSLATAIWFCGLSLVLTQAPVRRVFVRFGYWAERLMGAVLVALGVRLALANRG